MQPRISQRQSLACVECTRKKRKCSKEIPCTRCRRMGLECTREVVRLRRVVSQNGREIAFLESLRADLEGAGAAAGLAGPVASAKTAQVLRKLQERVQYLQSGQMPDGGDDGEASADAGRGSDDAPLPSLAALNMGRDDLHDARYRSRARKGKDQDAQDSLVVTALEHIAWGRNSGGCYPHRRCACQYSVHGGPGRLNHPSQALAGVWQHTPYQPVAARIVAEALPSRSLSEALVHFHVHHVAWHHSALHLPTFAQQCRRFWDTGHYEHPQWLALYLAVLSTAQFCLLHSSKYYRDGRFVSPDGAYLVDLDDAIQEDPAHPRSAQALFQGMLDVLHESQYLQNVSLHCVQAVVISTEVAHNLGLSQLNATLFAAAVRIAECLGLHKIEDDDDDVKDPAEKLDREVGRRVWLQMVVQDHFAMPFTDSYCIQPQQYATTNPRNCDDGEFPLLIEKPADMPTISSYNRVLATLARLVPELADGLGPLRARKPLHEQYEHILRMDAKMRQVVRAIPSYFLRTDAALEAQVPWLGIARQSMAITAAEKIIMVHRPFLFRAFQAAALKDKDGAGGKDKPDKDKKTDKDRADRREPPYQHTRRTCVSAAMTILREHRSITEAGEVSLWTHTAFCITAALLLSFEVLCTRSTADDDKTDDRQTHAYHSAIQYARTYLASRRHDVLAQRGVLLIDTLFPSGTESLSGSSLSGIPGPGTAAGSAANGVTPIRFDDIVSKFTVGWAMAGLTADWQQQQRQQVQVQHQQQQQQQQHHHHQQVHQPQHQPVPAYYDAPIPNLLPSQMYSPQPPQPQGQAPDEYGQFGVPEGMATPSLEDFDAWFQHIFTTGRGPGFGQPGVFS